MTGKYKKILAATLLILFVLYWAAVNFLVSAVLVPSFMEKLDAFQRISEQSYAEQVQETEMKPGSGACSCRHQTARRRQGRSLPAEYLRKHRNQLIRIAGSYCCMVTRAAKK